MPDLLRSRFWAWHVEHQPFLPEQEQAHGRAALAVLLDCIKTGEIVSLDGLCSPLSKRISEFHGTTDFEMNSNWICSSQYWTCPCCGRSKLQISRLGAKNQILGKLVVHHDHMGDAMKEAFHRAFEAAGTAIEQVEGHRLVERMGEPFAAYEEVLICEDCNNADTAAKKLVSCPPYFSFSIGQIRTFINQGEHRPHAIDHAKVASAWQRTRSPYELRMRLIETVAHAAATDTHWYEPHPRGANPVPLLGTRAESGDHAIRRWIDPALLVSALGPDTKPARSNLSRWRSRTQAVGKPPPANYLAMLRSDSALARAWDGVPDGWRCPVCSRSKQETVYMSDRGKVSFYPKTTTTRGLWRTANPICNQCESILMSLKWEASQAVGETPMDSYSFVRPEELTGIIRARPHSPHEIRQEEAAALLEAAISRLRAKGVERRRRMVIEA